MRGRLFKLLTCVFASLIGLEAAHAAPIEQQRLLYDQAKAALAKGDASLYLQSRNALQGYPLEPYLQYDELTARLKNASNTEIEAFLAEHGDLPQANWMKLRWLRWLSERGDWNTFDRYYDSKLNFTELDCLNAQHQIQEGQTTQPFKTAEKLWLVGKSQPAACDGLFSAWAARGQMPESMVWKRAKLAAEARNYGLVTHLGQQMPTLGSLANLMSDIAQKPQQLADVQRFTPASEPMADVVGLGLRRLAKQDPEKALGLLDTYSQRLPFSRDEKVSIAREIGLTLAKSFDPRALPLMERYDPELRDDTVSEWRARLLLRLARWKEAYQLIQRFPPSLLETNRWQYWRARTLELSQPQSSSVLADYQPVSRERDFYGFLAADRIKAPYQLNNRPLVLSNSLRNRVRTTPGIQRALEFYARGEFVNARREWFHVSRGFNRDELVAQARMAYDMQWYFPAIRSISQAKYWDDLDIRFPIAYRDSFVREARQRGLHSSWVFAITRQESGFMADARSGVGAMGLMQLMPATAKHTASKFSIPLASPQSALQPDTNIQLGTAYLSMVHAQFNGNRVLASAAYNAGPGRVKRWLKDARHLAFDVWVETIPFDETRQYVQNVLAYAVIYGQKLNTPQPLVEWHERFFDET
ncbi:transglycosylase SLT domain-containing protein [Pseudomonas luteola]|uniref:transglycosylase SLT domain-containing protein n=1 Tax=Pseudomonas luteola TaxID=47886 RepID=UPI003A8A474B